MADKENRQGLLKPDEVAAYKKMPDGQAKATEGRRLANLARMKQIQQDRAAKTQSSGTEETETQK